MAGGEFSMEGCVTTDTSIEVSTLQTNTSTSPVIIISIVTFIPQLGLLPPTIIVIVSLGLIPLTIIVIVSLGLIPLTSQDCGGGAECDQQQSHQWPGAGCGQHCEVKGHIQISHGPQRVRLGPKNSTLVNFELNFLKCIFLKYNIKCSNDFLKEKKTKVGCFLKS